MTSRPIKMACAVLCLCAAFVSVRRADAAELGASGLGSTQVSSADKGAADAATSLPGGGRGHGPSLWLQGTGDDRALAQAWRITPAELRRAREVMAGPRGAFADPAISPVEVLGIQATSAGERQRYARLLAQISAADTLQVLAWIKVLRQETAAVAATLPQMAMAASPAGALPAPTRAVAMGPVATNRSPAERLLAPASAANAQTPGRRAP